MLPRTELLRHHEDDEAELNSSGIVRSETISTQEPITTLRSVVRLMEGAEMAGEEKHKAIVSALYSPFIDIVRTD